MDDRSNGNQQFTNSKKHGHMTVDLELTDMDSNTDMKLDGEADERIQLFAAVGNGNVEKLKLCLQVVVPPLKDEKGKTPLHAACSFENEKTALEMVKAIILTIRWSYDGAKWKDLINQQDNCGKTGLHIAAETGHRSIVRMLILTGADVSIRDNNNTKPLTLIYQKFPGVMTSLFDDAISYNKGDRFTGNVEICLNFGCIVGYPTEEDPFIQRETKLLSCCLLHSENIQEKILLHPLVQTFLFFKWEKIKIIAWMSIFLHVIWLLLCATFMVCLYLVYCPYEIHSDMYKQDFSTVQIDEDFLREPNADLKIQADSFVHCTVKSGALLALKIILWVLLASSLLILTNELYELYSKKLLYFRRLENMGQCSLLTLVALTSIPMFVQSNSQTVILLQAWQYQASAVGIFLACTLIISEIGKFSTLRIYIEILRRVLQRFSMFMLTFTFLLIAFTLAFQVLLPKKLEFQDFPWGFVKVLIMVIGEINYDAMFYSADAATMVPFPTSTKLLLAAFVCFVTIMLFNLLIGLTVTDIQELQKAGQLTCLSKQLDQINLIEKVILSKRLQTFLQTINKMHWIQHFLVTQQTEKPKLQVRGISLLPRDSDRNQYNMEFKTPIMRIPKYLRDPIRELAAFTSGHEQTIGKKSRINSSSVRNVPQPETGQATENIGSAAELKAVVRDVLQEFVEDLRNLNK